MDVYAEESGTVPPDLVLALRSAFDWNCVDEFWSVWSAGSEVGLLRSCRRAGGSLFWPPGLRWSWHSADPAASTGWQGCWEVVVLVSCTELLEVMMWTCRLLFPCSCAAILEAGYVCS